MASIFSAHAYYVNAGWCAGCGRKRDRDGACSNCDRWYHSPLVMAGGPLVLATALLLYIGITTLRPAAPAPSAAADTSAAAPLLSAPQYPGRPAVYSAVSPALAPPPVVVSAPASALPGAAGFSFRSNMSWQEAEERRARARFLQQEALRQAVARADAQVSADDAARAARERAAVVAALRLSPSPQAQSAPYRSAPAAPLLDSAASIEVAPDAAPETGNPAAAPLVW